MYCLLNVRAEWCAGGQEHFYFEPQVTIAQPVDSEMVLHASTQNANKTQKLTAAVLDQPQHKVSCSLRRIGGGFGGKVRTRIHERMLFKQQKEEKSFKLIHPSTQETSNILYSCCAAVAAHNLNRPVRLLLSRDEDMEWTGKRHPFEGQYKVGYRKDGKITGVDVKVCHTLLSTLRAAYILTPRCSFTTMEATRTICLGQFSSVLSSIRTMSTTYPISGWQVSIRVSLLPPIQSGLT